MLRKTKIVCTIGPASDSEEIITGLFDAGMNVSRHNFSHGDHQSHGATMERVRRIAGEKGLHPAILLDTKGPEIRVRKFKGGKVFLKEGETVTIIGGEDFLGDETRFAITYKDFEGTLEKGNHILLNDGLVDLEIVSVQGNTAKTIVRNSGEISDNKSSNFPGVKTNLPALTEQDRRDIKLGVDFGVDMIAASFIRKASDVLAIRKVLHEFGGDDIQIYAKIENQEGVDNIDEIIRYSDGIMVARGDLGVEIPLEQIPVIQKMIIRKCNTAGKAVITATQMLDSMVRNPRPTRAEVSDVANAIMDGSDAVMLSGETASGDWPLETVRTMARIAVETEAAMDYDFQLGIRLETRTSSVQSAISAAVVQSANRLEAKAIITATQSGATARNISKFRPQSVIVAVTPIQETARRLACSWGVYPILSEPYETTDEMIEKTTAAAKIKGFVGDGDLVVLTAGIPMNYRGSTNLMKIQIIGDVLLEGTGRGLKRVVSGIVNIVHNPEEAARFIKAGDIMVVDKLTDHYSDTLPECGGIVVQSEIVTPDMLVAVMSRQLVLITGAKGAMTKLLDGTMITLDGRIGVVTSGQAKVH